MKKYTVTYEPSYVGYNKWAVRVDGVFIKAEPDEVSAWRLIKAIQKREPQWTAIL